MEVWSNRPPEYGIPDVNHQWKGVIHETPNQAAQPVGRASAVPQGGTAPQVIKGDSSQGINGNCDFARIHRHQNPRFVC